MLRSFPALLTFLASPVLAADITVGPGGSIQTAIDAASAGDRVIVLPGFYVESLDMKGKAIELVGLLGADVTTLSGSYGTGPVISMAQGEGPGTRIRGFTITGGWGGFGGGIAGIPQLGPRATAIVEDCIIRGNQAYRGGGVAGDFTLIRCLIEQNNAGTFSAIGWAGGVYGAPVMRECAVVNNTVVKGSCGGVYLSGTNPAILEDCVIAGNRAYNVGGGILVEPNATATIRRCLVTANTLSAGCFGYCGPGASGPALGSAICAFEGSTVLIESCVLVDNVGAGGTAGAPVGAAGDMTIADSILRGNNGDQVDTAVVTYSNVEGGAPGPGNFDADPLFVNAPGGDFHLAAGSPCIDAGTPGKLDPDGSPLDVGAYPFAELYARRDVAIEGLPGWGSLSADLGGVHPLRIHAGSGSAGRPYLILGSVTGTSPGTPVLGATLPLVADAWFATTLANPNSKVLVNTLGVLGPAGTADASIALPPGIVMPAKAWHAALVLDAASLTATATSAVELRLE